MSLCPQRTRSRLAAVTPGRRSPRGASSGRAALLIAALLPLAAGCEVRDEELAPRSRAAAWRPDSLPTSALMIDGLTDGHDAIAFAKSYAIATDQATALGRPLLLVFRAGWCRWSGHFAQGPLAERRVIAMSRQFVCATVDADRDAGLCREFGVTAFPTVLLIDAAGTERFRATGVTATSGLPDAMAGLLDRPTQVDRVAEGGTSPPR